MGQENPWKTNNQEKTSESLRGENPWTNEVKVENEAKIENKETSDKSNQKIEANSTKPNVTHSVVDFGYTNYEDQAAVLFPAVLGSLPGIGFLFMLGNLVVPPSKNKIEKVKKAYGKKFVLELSKQEENALKKGARRKKVRNNVIGSVIGTLGQVIIVLVIFN